MSGGLSWTLLFTVEVIKKRVQVVCGSHDALHSAVHCTMDGYTQVGAACSCLLYSPHPCAAVHVMMGGACGAPQRIRVLKKDCGREVEIAVDVIIDYGLFNLRMPLLHLKDSINSANSVP